MIISQFTDTSNLVKLLYFCLFNFFSWFSVNFVTPQILSSESLSDGSVFIRWADLDLGWRTTSRQVNISETILLNIHLSIITIAINRTLIIIGSFSILYLVQVFTIAVQKFDFPVVDLFF